MLEFTLLTALAILAALAIWALYRRNRLEAKHRKQALRAWEGKNVKRESADGLVCRYDPKNPLHGTRILVDRSSRKP